jgi:tetratricopeptide (TPR) repeat protein
LIDKEKAQTLFDEARKISLETRPPNVPHRAIALAEAALSEDPDFINAAALLANDLRRANNYEKSIDMYKYALSRAEAQEPDNYKLLRNLLRDLGRVLVLAKKYEEAVKYLERSLDIEYSSASEYLADAYNKLGKYEEVIKLYANIDPSSDDGRMVDEPALYMGIAYKQLGMKEKAEIVFEAGLRFNPANDDIKAELNNLKGGKKMSEKSEWKEAMGPHQFKACVDNDIDFKYGGADVRAKSETNALGCVKCFQANPLEACKNCGNQTYSFGVGEDGKIGLFCIKCKQGFTSWNCICGAVNPISSNTLLAKGKSGGCFIATAAFDNEMAPEVIYLRQYRDCILNQSKEGRFFVKAYYILSPSIAKVISKSFFLKKLTRNIVLRPIIQMIDHFYPTLTLNENLRSYSHS